MKVDMFKFWLISLDWLQNSFFLLRRKKKYFQSFRISGFLWLFETHVSLPFLISRHRRRVVYEFHCSIRLEETSMRLKLIRETTRPSHKTILRLWINVPQLIPKMFLDFLWLFRSVFCLRQHSVVECRMLWELIKSFQSFIAETHSFPQQQFLSTPQCRRESQKKIFFSMLRHFSKSSYERKGRRPLIMLVGRDQKKMEKWK